ncbi:MAG: sulfatase [Chloroflexota bacterium]|nr:sulfatase [Chloroflexota bacterium]
MSSRQPPHIVVITCHDLGRYLGCYGVGTVRTPNIDALAAAGARFTNAFTTAPQCSPSRAALATGRYPHCNGVMGLTHDRFGWDLHLEERTIASLLRERGYETHLFGLQHVTAHVERLGFDTVHTRGLGPVVRAEVKDLLANTNATRPLYLEINLEEPHRPFDQGGVAPDSALGTTVPPYIPDSAAAREEFAAFQGAVAVADHAVGQILATLDRAGLTEQTLALFTTDHGIAMPGAKCTLSDAGLGTALIIRWPAGGVPGGEVASPLISNIDILPTLLEASGGVIPNQVQGRSFLPLLTGSPYSARSEIFAEKTFHSYYDPIRAIRTNRYTYIRNFEATFLVEVPGDIQAGAIFRDDPSAYAGATHPPVELYDLAQDPHHRINRAGDPALAATERDLARRLWRWMEETADPLLAGPVPSPSYRRAMADRVTGTPVKAEV